MDPRPGVQTELCCMYILDEMRCTQVLEGAHLFVAQTCKMHLPAPQHTSSHMHKSGWLKVNTFQHILDLMWQSDLRIYYIFVQQELWSGHFQLHPSASPVWDYDRYMIKSMRWLEVRASQHIANSPLYFQNPPNERFNRYRMIQRLYLYIISTLSTSLNTSSLKRTISVVRYATRCPPQLDIWYVGYFIT